MDLDAKLAADTLRKMADFKQMLAFPHDTGKIINASADLIESLAAERDSLAERCRQLEARNDTLIAKEVLFDEAIAAGAKMQRERDAAVAGINCERSCRTCEYEKCKVDEEPCKSCTKGILDTWTNWQWRGVKETEHEP